MLVAEGLRRLLGRTLLSREQVYYQWNLSVYNIFKGTDIIKRLFYLLIKKVLPYKNYDLSSETNQI